MNDKMNLDTNFVYVKKYPEIPSCHNLLNILIEKPGSFTFSHSHVLESYHDEK